MDELFFPIIAPRSVISYQLPVIQLPVIQLSVISYQLSVIQLPVIRCELSVYCLLFAVGQRGAN
jgi:hypothetical protein